MVIAQKLRTAREEKDLSQEDVAKQLGVTAGAYGSFERATNLIALNYLIDLSRILQKPITYFLPPHVVTDAERNDSMHDPLLQELVANWPRIPRAVQENLLNVVGTYLDLLDKKARGDPLE